MRLAVAALMQENVAQIPEIWDCIDKEMLDIIFSPAIEKAYG